MAGLDALDVALLRELARDPRASVLELARALGVARGTATARLARLERSGVLRRRDPDVDLAAAGFPVQAFVTLELAQGSLEAAAADLRAAPGVLEAHVTTGQGDVLARVAAASHAELQATLLRLSRSPAVVRSTSVVVLSEVVGRRVMPLLAERARRRED